MTATPIVPGKAYRVSCPGRMPITVFASHPCDAICAALAFHY